MFSFAPQQPPTNSLFGATQPQPQPQSQQSQYSGMFGQQTAMSLPTIAQPVTGMPFPKETKFTDLPTDLRANLEAVERTLCLAHDQSVALASQPYTDTAGLARAVAGFADRVAVCEGANETCRGHVDAAKRVLNRFWRYGEEVARMIISSRQTGPDGQLKWVPVITPSDLSLLEEMIFRLETQVTELVDAAELNQSNRFSVDMLRSSLRHQHELFLALAGRVALLEEDLDRLKSVYRTFLTKYRGDTRDPFAPRTVKLKEDNSSGVGGLMNNNLAVNRDLGTQMLPNPPSLFTTAMKPPPAPAFNFSNNKRMSLPSAAQTPNPFLQTPR